MMKRFNSIALLLTCLALSANIVAQSQRWTEAKANAWYKNQPWLVGSNFIPSSTQCAVGTGVLLLKPS